MMIRDNDNPDRPVETCPRTVYSADFTPCPKPRNAPHPCPYQTDVNNYPDFECECCDDCIQECADDV